MATRQQSNIVKIAAINVNSICMTKRRYDLQKFVNENSIDIALLSETKLNAKHRVHLDNHTLVRNFRSNGRRGGGTVIAVHNRLQYQLLRANSTNKVMEYTAIKIKVNSKDSLLIFSIYATQNTTTTFINELDKLASDYNLDRDNVFYVIAGDFNARNTEWRDSVTNDQNQCFLIGKFRKASLGSDERAEPALRRPWCLLPYMKTPKILMM